MIYNSEVTMVSLPASKCGSAEELSGGMWGILLSLAHDPDYMTPKGAERLRQWFTDFENMQGVEYKMTLRLCRQMASRAGMNVGVIPDA